MEIERKPGFDADHPAHPREELTIVSRHGTAEGTVVYARCACRRWTIWLERDPAAMPIATL